MLPQGSERCAMPRSLRVSRSPHAVRLPKRPGPKKVAFAAR